MAVISVQDLQLSFGERTVLRGIDLEVEAGEIVALMGSSGGGKTTLLRCIAGLLVPQKGRIAVDGVDVLADPEGARRHMGMVFQGAALFDYLNVYENIRFGVSRHMTRNRAEQQQIVLEALKEVGLEGAETKLPAELSGGMRKRVGLARALALRPQVLLYDEPTTGLDPITTYSIDQLILEVNAHTQSTSLVVSHDLASVFRIADRIAFLHQGSLDFIGNRDAFCASDHPAIRELIERAEVTA